MVLIQPAALLRRNEPVRPAFRSGGRLALGLFHHPVWTMTLALFLAGAGMLAAVTLSVLVCVLPLGLLFGWY